jgi:2-amino-4-hydroxy-6-hydroxymethyldihydropteridine diphosphokinase
MADGNSESVNVFISVGSNIAPAENLRMACRELEASFGELNLSAVYQTPAVGFEGDDFLNMVISLHSVSGMHSIVSSMETLHRKAKRVRLENPYSPRTLDLDVLLYGSVISQRLKLPHDDIEKYGFVLGPLAEIAPDLRHPVVGQTMREMWAAFDTADCPMQRVDIGLTAVDCA